VRCPFRATAAADCYGSNIDKNPNLEPSTFICDGNSDNFFTTEPEQNIVSPSGKTPDDLWPIRPGNVRPKNDFSHAYAQADTVDSPCDPDTDQDDVVLHLGGHVGDNEGSHFWGFEFNEVAPENFDLLKEADGDVFILNFNRQVGDLLISFTVPGSGNDPVVLEIFQITGFQPDGDAIFSLATPVLACPDPPDPNERGFTRLETNNFNDVEAPRWNIPVCDPTDDNRGSAEYKRDMVKVLVPRAAKQALQRDS